MGLKRQKGLMVAIDATEEREYENLKNVLLPISELNKEIVFMPGIPTLLSFGFPKVINLLQHYDNKIVFNAKLAEDSQEKANQMLNLCKERNLDGIIVHGFINERIMRSLVENSEDTDIIAVARMSSENPFYDRYYKEIAESAVNCGAKGIVMGATHPESISEIRSIIDEIDDSTYICSPGIGKKYQGGDARTVLEKGTDYLIIGRAILKADDPEGKTIEYLKLLGS